MATELTVFVIGAILGGAAIGFVYHFKLQASLARAEADWAAAAEKNSRIPLLEADLQQSEANAAELAAEVSALKQGEVELKTRLEAERTAAEEKLALLSDARQQLGD